MPQNITSLHCIFQSSARQFGMSSQSGKRFFQPRWCGWHFPLCSKRGAECYPSVPLSELRGITLGLLLCSAAAFGRQLSGLALQPCIQKCLFMKEENQRVSLNESAVSKPFNIKTSVYSFCVRNQSLKGQEIFSGAVLFIKYLGGKKEKLQNFFNRFF